MEPSVITDGETGRTGSMSLRQRVGEFYVASAVEWGGRDMVA